MSINHVITIGNSEANGLKGRDNDVPVEKKGMVDAQLARALNKSATPMAVVNRQSIICWANEAYFKLTGHVNIKDDTLRMSCLSNKDERVQLLKSVWTYLEDGRIWKGELLEKSVNNFIIPVEVVITPIDYSNGKPILFLVTMETVNNTLSSTDYQWQMANKDPITGLGNRNALNTVFELNLAMSQRNQKQCAMLYISINGFRAYSTKNGVDKTDKLIKEIAEILKMNIRRSDYIARVKANGFACILTEISKNNDANEVAAKINSALNTIYKNDRIDNSISFGIGCAKYPDDSMDMDHLFNIAKANSK